ncbi:MAG TPA: FAD/NAD(P)-binding oxidoreductase [Candidatus Deferrimicrobiaceae bacterium]
MERVLIVGNGYAGSRAAELLAGLGRFDVIRASDEEHPAYCRHLLPEVAAGERSPEDLHLPPGDGGGPSVPHPCRAAVERLDPGAGKAVLAGGEEIPFDKALIATGARVFVPGRLRDLFGQLGNVRSMRKMGDALALRRTLGKKGARVVIVGAGRIGVLLSEALKRAGARIALVDIAPEILPTMLQADVAARLRPHLESGGDLSVLAGRTVDRVATSGGNAEAVHLSDGTVLPCDFAVLATGVVPNTGFLEGDWGDLAGGIPVDARMETRHPGVYAAGDVIFFETLSGKKEPGQLILNARLQAEVAARNIAGDCASCPPIFTGNVVKIGTVLGAVAGEVEGAGHEEFRLGDSYLRVTMDGAGMTGFQFVGRPGDLRGLVPGVLKRVDAAWLRQTLGVPTGLGMVPPLLAGGRVWA